MTIPVACVVTETHIKEFLLLKFSLETYHSCKWYLACDEFSYNELKKFENCVCRKTEIKSGNVFGTPESSSNFFNAVLEKFTSSREALKENPYVLLLDSDIIFTNPLDCRFHELANSNLDLVASPHYQWNPTMDAAWGKYNVGFNLLKSTKFIDAWEALTLKKIHRFEQVPMAKLLETDEFVFEEFPINYNMGWWRFNNNLSRVRLNSFDFKAGRIVYDGSDVVSFHFHTFVECVHSQKFKPAIFDALAQSKIYESLLNKYEEIKGLYV